MAPSTRKLRKRKVFSYEEPKISDDDHDDEDPNIQERDDGRGNSQDDSHNSDNGANGSDAGSDHSHYPDDDSDGADDSSDPDDDFGLADAVSDDSHDSDAAVDGSEEEPNGQGHGQSNPGGQSSAPREAEPSRAGLDREEGDQAMIGRKIKIAISSLTRRAGQKFDMDVFDTMTAEAKQLISERSSIDGYWKSFGLEDFVGSSDIPAGPVGLIFLNEAIKKAVEAQKESFWTLVIRWYQEVVELAKNHVGRRGHEEQNVYTSCRLLLCTRRSYTPPHPPRKELSTKSTGHNGYEFPFLFQQDDVWRCIQMLKSTVDPLKGPGGEEYFRPSSLREVGYPLKYGEIVYVARPHNWSTADDKMFPLFTERSRARKKISFKHELKKENFSSNEDAARKNDRIAKVLESFEAQLKEHETPKGEALKSGLDAFTGLLIQMPSDAFGPSAEAIAPAAYFRDLLTYHAPAAVVIVFRFLNDAKGANLFAADIALAAEWKRVFSDSAMPWEECRKRLRWLGTAMDNLAIIRQLLGFTKNHGPRHKEWERLNEEDLNMLLETALTGRKTSLLQEKIRQAKQGGRQILPLAVDHNRTRIPVQDSDKQRIQANCLEIAKRYELSEEEFEAYLCLGGEICPFHVLSHEDLRDRGYDIRMLRAILEDSDFHKKCNKDAVGLGIHELDIDNHWDRLLDTIMHEKCQQVVKAIMDVKERRPSWKQGSAAFIEEVQWRIVDRHGFPLLPYQSHSFGYVLAKRGPPNTAMFTGTQERLFTVGEARHADNYHHVRSYDDALRTMCCEARISNEIEKSSHPTLWEKQFDIHMMVPVDGAYWKIDRALGNQRFDRNDSPDTTPPGPSYCDLNLGEPPIGQLLSGQEGPLTFTCPNEDCNVVDVHAGEFQLHLNRDHSTWELRCEKCGRHFPDLGTMGAHTALKSCLADDAVEDAVDYFEGHLSCQADGCSMTFVTAWHLSEHEDTHKAVEERDLPRFRCVCGCFWADKLKSIGEHQGHQRHESAMAAKGKHKLGAQSGVSNADRERNEFYSGLDQSLFYTVTKEYLSQQGSSSGKRDEKEYKRSLAGRERSVNKAIQKRKDEKKDKGKYHCERCCISCDDKRDLDKHLATENHKIAEGTYTFADWQQAKAKRSEQKQAEENAAAAADPLGAAMKKLDYKVLERIRKQPVDTEGQNICDACFGLVGRKQDMERHQKADYCQKTKAILQSINSDIKIAQNMIRERLLAKQPAQAPSTQPQCSSSAEANDAGDEMDFEWDTNDAGDEMDSGWDRKGKGKARD